MAESRVITDLITCKVPDHGIDAPVELRYDPADPFAIALDDTGVARAIDPDDTSERRPWSFLRSLLTDALVADGPFGLHDVVIERDDAWVLVALSSHEGATVLRFTHASLLRFAQRTARLVPLGRESEHLDVDTAIARLLDGAGR